MLALALMLLWADGGVAAAGMADAHGAASATGATDAMSWASIVVLVGGVLTTCGGLVLGWLYSGKRAMDRIDDLTARQFKLTDELTQCKMDHANAAVREAGYKADLQRAQVRIENLEAKAGILPPLPFVPGMLITDLEGNIQEYSPSLTMFLGWTSDEMLGKNISLLVPSDGQEEHKARMAEYANPGNNPDPSAKINTTLVDKNGRRVPVVITLRKWPGIDGKLTAMVGLRPSVAAGTIPPGTPHRRAGDV